MSIVPSRRAINMYVGTVSDWMESVGVSGADKDALYCDHCPERDNEDFPWSCDKLCPNRKGQLFWKELNAEEDFGIFMKALDMQSMGDTDE